MTEDEMLFLSLCGPLEDAMDYLDNGQPERARALLERVLKRAHAILEEQQDRPCQ